MLFASLLFGILLFGGTAWGAPAPVKKTEVSSATDASYFFLLAEEEAHRNDLTEAIANLDRAIEKEPGQAYLWFKRASYYAAMGELKKAQLDLLKALELSPADPQSLILLGKISQTLNRPSEAIVNYQKALESDPNSIDGTLLLMEAYVSAKNYRAALGLVRAWERREPDQTDPLLYEAWLQQNFFQNSAAAIAAYRKVLNLEPENSKVLASIAEIYLSRKQNLKALEVFLQMEMLAPHDVSVRLKHGLINFDYKQYDRAVQKFKEVLKLYPEADRVIYYLGVIYENLNKDDEAKDQFEKIKPPSGFFKDARLHLAFLFRRGKKEEEAIRVLEDSIETKPGIGSFYQ